MYNLSLQSVVLQEDSKFNDDQVSVMQIFQESTKSGYVSYMEKHQYRTHLASLFLVFRDWFIGKKWWKSHLVTRGQEEN